MPTRADPYQDAGATPPASRSRSLYVTNSRSGTLTIFTIGRSGALTPVGEPVPTGALPRGTVFTPEGRTAYVVNSGANQVSVYRVGEHGQLTQLSPPAATGEFPFAIAIAPNGRSLYVSNFGTPDARDGTVSAFAVERDGTLTPLGGPLPSGAERAKGVAVTPDGRFLYVSHGMPSDTEPGAVTTFALQEDGTLRRTGAAVTIGRSGAGVAVSPNGRFLYVACQGSDEVFGFSIGPDGDLAPVPGSPFLAPDFPEGAAVTPDGRHLFVTAVNSGAVWAFAIGAGGTLEPVVGAPFTAGSGAVGVTPTPDGRHLYVSNFGSGTPAAGTVTSFALGDDGGLRELPGSPMPSSGDNPAFQSAAVSPDQGPVAAFSARVGAPGHVMRFDASASSDPDGRVTRYDWDFGDGNARPDGGVKPAHIYEYPGAFTVTLTVTDNEGCSTSLVFTGQSMLCNGSPAAQIQQTIVVKP